MLIKITKIKAHKIKNKIWINQKLRKIILNIKMFVLKIRSQIVNYIKSGLMTKLKIIKIAFITNKKIFLNKFNLIQDNNFIKIFNNNKE